MIYRTRSFMEAEKHFWKYRKDTPNLDIKDWLTNYDNIALTDGAGNFCLFEFELPGVYSGHYFFNVRGKEAVKLAKEMLNKVFNCPEVEIIRGLTPVEKLGARWLSRKLGFTSYGAVETKSGYCELFIQTKEEYNNKEDDK